MKRFLHVGAAGVGEDYIGRGFKDGTWEEVSFDLDPSSKPDILGDMTDMKAVPSVSFEGIFTSHTIEHLYPDDVRRSFQEFYRVLVPGGLAVIACPDLEAAAQEIVNGRLLEPAYHADGTPIAPIDLLYGWRGFLAQKEKREFMVHHTGFTLPVLLKSLESVGFVSVAGRRLNYELWVCAFKEYVRPEVMTDALNLHCSR